MQRGFGIYVHTPFCVHKCSYCDFYSFSQYDETDFNPLFAALKKELESSQGWIRENLGTPKVTSIFFGGGTPSLIPPKLIRQCLTHIEERFELDPNCEITLEANPETVTKEFCDKLLMTKVTRVSLGAQSFQQKYLDILERIAKPESIVRAATLLWESGYRNFNLDLIFGIPGQNESEMKDDIARVAALSPKHISSYNLTLKPGHPFYSKLPDSDTTALLYECVVSEMVRLGYQQYEISNYAKLGYECRHNLLYWEGGDYLGIGPSAASRFFVNGVFVHRKQKADLKLYLQNPLFDKVSLELTDKKQTVLEATFLEMRTNQGVALKEFQDRYGYDLRTGKDFELFKQEGFIHESSGRLKLTEKGRLLADTVTERLADLNQVAKANT